MKKLKIPDKKVHKGLVIYCKKCGKEVHNNPSSCLEKCKKENGSEKNHYEHWTYKAVVYITGTKKRKAKNIETRDLDEAYLEVVQFKKQIRDNEFVQEDKRQKEREVQGLTVEMALFNYSHNYLNNIGVPHGMKQKVRTKDYISEVQKSCTDFMRCLRTIGIQPETFLVSELTKFHTDPYCKWLEENYSERSYNNNIGRLRTAFKQIIEYQEADMRNPFLRLAWKQPPTLPNEIISRNEFEAVLNAIGKIDPYTVYSGKRVERKNNYAPYLKDVYRLALFSGLRREEWATLTFSDIYEAPNGNKVIIIDNKKVERITGKKYKPKVIPVGKEIQELLDELDYENFKGTDMYLIHPTRDAQRGEKVAVKTMMDKASKAFTHYYKKVFGEENFKQMKCLRKTYISLIYNKVGDEVGDFTSQTKEVIADHYLNKLATTKIIQSDFWDNER